MDDEKIGYLMCFTGVFTWSFSEIIVKKLQGAAGPVSLSFLRFFLGGIFLLLIMMFQKDTKDTLKIVKKHPKLSIIASMFGLGISNVIYFTGIQYTQANVGSALYTTYPIFISIYSIYILGEKSNIKRKFLGLFLGFIGTAILITNFQFGLFIESDLLLGNILLVLAASIWALYSVLGKKIFKLEAIEAMQSEEAKKAQITNIEIKWTTISFFISCIPIIIILPFTNELDTFLLYSPVEWGYILFLSFLSTAFGLYIFFIGIRKIDVSKGISLALMKPILVSILAFLILGELPTIGLVIAIPLISIAVLLINKKQAGVQREPGLFKVFR
jgi:drug/metabolite transporter (DMT)-like permease